MQELIQNFGVNWMLLIAQIVNFLILFYLLKRFAYKPVLKMLSDRKKTIEEGVKSAEDGRVALGKALEEEKAILQKAQTNARQILADAKQQAEVVGKEMEEQARQQVADMLEDAKVQMQRDQKEMEKQLALSTAKIAVEMVENSLANLLTKKEQEEVVTKFAKNLKVKK